MHPGSRNCPCANDQSKAVIIMRDTRSTAMICSCWWPEAPMGSGEGPLRRTQPGRILLLPPAGSASPLGNVQEASCLSQFPGPSLVTSLWAIPTVLSWNREGFIILFPLSTSVILSKKLNSVVIIFIQIIDKLWARTMCWHCIKHITLKTHFIFTTAP